MESTHTSILTRDDTFFGVCEALGQDFGFNPFYLRLALGIGLIWNPVAMVAVYAAGGLVIAATRFIAPDPRVVEPVETDRTSVEAPLVGGGLAQQGDGAQPLVPAAV